MMMGRLGDSAVFLLFVVCLGLFLLFPQLDLEVAARLYEPGEGFIFAETPPVRWVYEVFARMGAVLGVGLLGFWIWRRGFRGDTGRDWQRRVLYLVVVLALGPGLVVNGAFKADSGRARPMQVTEFGGARAFTGFGMPAAQCRKNCSSVSGHAAVGFFFIAFAWALRSRAWLLGGILIGAAVGAGRMMQGGHFLSDILFSFWAVYFVAYFSARWLFGEDSPVPGR